ncbi:sensor histidine kinase [Lentisphaera araneosa HTCC2155]|uniref:histidine kinase n=1 Tax=Lentisphaera araneosa HTCC2155 TaxID=313628 RepID=A6DNJ3_9BACT|nr:HAMP domain-containing sensor histidine kinase [Lentisphaera araneosa]EDM26652.1 sensor histidine kinase [Lentisphaera araneosa HTCC2155]
MPLKIISIFSFIILIPSLSIFYLGSRLNESEESMLRARYYAAEEERLELAVNQSTLILEKLEKGLLPLLKKTAMDNESINELSSSSIYIKHLFILNPKGKIIYPLSSSEALTPREADFLERNDHILRDPQTYSNSQDKSTGWYSWYAGKNLNLILWTQTSDQFTVGVELHHDRLISEIIKNIPDKLSEESYQLVLRSAESQLYRSSTEPSTYSNILKAELPAPLQSFQFAYHFNEPVFISPLRQYFLIGFSLLTALSLSGICFLLYRERRRNILESTQRVNFANQVSHELKTPLTNIRMYAELLQNRLDDEDPKVMKRLNVIITESHRLSRMINNVLNFAKWEKGKIFIKTDEVIPDQICTDTLSKFDLAFHKKKLTINSHLNASKSILADPDLFTQIMGNLFSNIEKYVPDNCTIDISSLQTEKQTEIIVQDNGHGIPKKHHGKIFQSFYRISNQMSDGVTGTGIGLAIARDFARAHGGELELIPSQEGACFKLTLPNLGNIS